MALEVNLRPNPIGDLLYQLGWAGIKREEPPLQPQSLSQKLLDLSLHRELAYIKSTTPETPVLNPDEFDAGEHMETLFASIENSDRYFDAIDKRNKGMITFLGLSIEEIGSYVNFTIQDDIQLQIKAGGVWGIYSLLEGTFIESPISGDVVKQAEEISEQFTGPGGEVLTIARSKDAPPQVYLRS